MVCLDPIFFLKSHPRLQIDPLAPDAYHSPDVHVFGARGLRWKRIRTISSRALSTSQLREMLPIILEQTEDFINYLSNILTKRNNHPFYETDIHAYVFIFCFPHLLRPINFAFYF